MWWSRVWRSIVPPKKSIPWKSFWWLLLFCTYEANEYLWRDFYFPFHTFGVASGHCSSRIFRREGNPCDSNESWYLDIFGTCTTRMPMHRCMLMWFSDIILVHIKCALMCTRYLINFFWCQVTSPESVWICVKCHNLSLHLHVDGCNTQKKSPPPLLKSTSLEGNLHHFTCQHNQRVIPVVILFPV